MEDILHERGVDMCHEAVQFWVGRFGSKFTGEIRKNRAERHSNWQWHLDEVFVKIDEVFVKINGERVYLWGTVDHEGVVPECFVTQRHKKATEKNFIIKTMQKHGSPKTITTDKFLSYGAAFSEIGNSDKQLCGGRSNNRCENSHLPFRRRERAMQKFKSCAMVQKFTSYHAQIYNHFNHERHLESRQIYKQKRETVRAEWFQICA